MKKRNHNFISSFEPNLLPVQTKKRKQRKLRLGQDLSVAQICTSFTRDLYDRGDNGYQTCLPLCLSIFLIGLIWAVT